MILSHTLLELTHIYVIGNVSRTFPVYFEVAVPI